MSEQSPVRPTVDGPTEHDIILGRSATAKNHPGNVLFRSIVTKNKPLYMSRTKRGEKNEVTQLVIDTVQQLGARFLAQTEDGKWTVADDKRIFEKVNQALREGQAVIKKQLQAAALAQQQSQASMNPNQLQAAELSSNGSVGMNSLITSMQNQSANAPIAPSPIAPAPIAPAPVVAAPTTQTLMPQNPTFPVQQQPAQQPHQQLIQQAHQPMQQGPQAQGSSATQEQLAQVLQEIQDIQSYQELNQALTLLQQRRESLEVELQLKQQRQRQQLIMLKPLAESAQFENGAVTGAVTPSGNSVSDESSRTPDINRSHLTTDPDDDTEMAVEGGDQYVSTNEDLLRMSLQRLQAESNSQRVMEADTSVSGPNLISSIRSNGSMDPDLLRRSLLSLQSTASRVMEGDTPHSSTSTMTMDEDSLRNSIMSLQSAASGIAGTQQPMEAEAPTSMNTDEDYVRMSILANQQTGVQQPAVQQPPMQQSALQPSGVQQSGASADFSSNANMNNDSDLLQRLSVLTSALNQHSQQQQQSSSNPSNNMTSGMNNPGAMARHNLNTVHPSTAVQGGNDSSRPVSDPMFDESALSTLTEEQRMAISQNLREQIESFRSANNAAGMMGDGSNHNHGSLL